MNINDRISEADDNLAAEAIVKCHKCIRDLPTVTQMKIAYNLMIDVFRLFTICGENKGLHNMIEAIKQGLLDEIDENNELPDQLDREITFSDDSAWVMKIVNINGVRKILFNIEDFSDLTENDFAKKVIEILHESRLLDDLIVQEAKNLGSNGTENTKIFS